MLRGKNPEFQDRNQNFEKVVRIPRENVRILRNKLNFWGKIRNSEKRSQNSKKKAKLQDRRQNS